MPQKFQAKWNLSGRCSIVLGCAIVKIVNQ